MALVAVAPTLAVADEFGAARGVTVDASRPSGTM
jgi:hypothetical protein